MDAANPSSKKIRLAICPLLLCRRLHCNNAWKSIGITIRISSLLELEVCTPPSLDQGSLILYKDKFDHLHVQGYSTDSAAISPPKMCHILLTKMLSVLFNGKKA